MDSIRLGLIGCGRVALANYVPAAEHCGVTIAAVCSRSEKRLAKAREATGAEAFERWEDLLAEAEVEAVAIATPNYLHKPIACAAMRSGRHVLCEKPLAMSLAEARQMLDCAERAGVRHMTSFTYRFAPGLRQMAELVGAGGAGEPFVFHARRYYDNAGKTIGWRQRLSEAGFGVSADFLSHRLDLAMLMLGPITEVSAELHTFVTERSGEVADTDDWCNLTVRFAGGARGVLEASRVATGYGTGAQSPDDVIVTGSEATLAYSGVEPNVLRIGLSGGALETQPVPERWLKHPASTRDAAAGEPKQVFRWDQLAEFADAIRTGREAAPSFADGVRVQAVLEAAAESDRRRCWVAVEPR